MMSLTARLAAILAVSSVAIAGAALPLRADDGAPGADRKWEAWTELGGYGSNQSEAQRGEIALWAPLAQTGHSILFADLRGKFFAEEEREGNAALGYRFLGASGWNPGFWIGLDRRRTEFGSDFDQFSFGAELLSADWDLRANFYLPLDDSEQVSGAGGAPAIEIIGNQIFLVSGGLYELAFHGFDAEIGYRVPIERFGWNDRANGSFKDGARAQGGRYHDFRVFLGGYYFDHDDFDGEVAGPRLRAEWRIENIIEAWEGSRLTFEAAYQYDDLRESQFEAGLRLRIPLGSHTSGDHYALSPQEKRMAEGIKRDTDVVSVSQTQTADGGGSAVREPVEDALSGVDFNTVTIVANGADLNAALAGAGGNALIIAAGGATSFGAITLLPNQTLLGGGGALQLRGLTTGTLATYHAPGTRPVIVGSAPVGNAPAAPFPNGLVILNHNTHVAGVLIQGVGAVGGQLDNSSNSNSARVNGLGSGTGVRIEESATAFLTNSEIQNTYIGILMDQDNSNLTVRNTTIANNQLHGIVMAGGNTSLDIRDSFIGDLFGHGIMVSTQGNANLTVANTTFSGNFDGAAFYFDAGTTAVTSSTGNVDAITSGVRCMFFNGSFTGSIGFNDNTAVTQANCQDDRL
jgi:hypothetical protein